MQLAATSMLWLEVWVCVEVAKEPPAPANPNFYVLSIPAPDKGVYFKSM